MGRLRYEGLLTEARHPASAGLDRLPAAGIARLMAQADREAAAAVRRAGPAVARAIDLAAGALGAGGRLIFVGAGTSGRLGVLEAAECPPTFGTRPSLVQAVMAGGRRAVFRSREGAEDDEAAARRQVRRRARAGDLVVGIAASGVTPFVAAALATARKSGAGTVLLTANPRADRRLADHVMVLSTGPEVLAGSTRLKAGTATKMVLNALTTGAFVRLGKVHDNRMVDLDPRSAKLRARARALVRELGGVSGRRAATLLARAGGRVKVAVVMARRRVGAGEARRLLGAAGGALRPVLERQRAPRPRRGARLAPARRRRRAPPGPAGRAAARVR